MRNLLISVAILAAGGSALFAVLYPPRTYAQPAPAFEVASVKLSGSQQPQMGFTGIPLILRGKLDTVTYTHVLLKGVIARAYNLRPGEITGPSWLDSTFYDIIAKAPPDATAEQLPAMLQGLLADRFRMRVHWDTRQEAGYALVVLNTGAKLKTSVAAPESAAMSFTMGGPDRHIEYNRTTLDEFAKSLTVNIGRPVANMTSIEGLYDIAFDCSADSVPGLNPMNAPTEAGSAPSIFSAIKTLGLNLVAQRVPVKRLVVDSVERTPTEN